MTKKDFVLIVLFFGSLWGTAEAILGGTLHRAEVPYAAVPLAIIAFAVLTIARAYCPRAGSSTLIASCAMLFKFANAPFWGCHLLGILLLGVAYDLILMGAERNVPADRRGFAKNALIGTAASYLGFALFAVLITYVFRYAHWAHEGLPRVLNHTFVAGTMAAVGSAIVVPLSAQLAGMLKSGRLAAPKFRSRLTTGSMSVLTVLLWVLAVTVTF